MGHTIIYQSKYLQSLDKKILKIVEKLANGQKTTKALYIGRGWQGEVYLIPLGDPEKCLKVAVSKLGTIVKLVNIE